MRATGSRRRANAPWMGAYDALICGASFAGLAAARELPAPGRDVLVLDRYEIGERADLRLRDPDRVAAGAGADGGRAAALRRAGRPHRGRHRRCSTCPTPSRPSTTTRCANCSGASATPSSRSPRSKAARRAPTASGADLAVETDRGTVSAPLVVDALGWRRLLAPATRPAGRRAADPRAGGPPRGTSEDLEVWVDRRYARAGYGWCFPAGEELRIGACSYDPRDHVREGTDVLAADLGARAGPLPGQLDPARAARPDRRRASSSPATRPATACR